LRHSIQHYLVLSCGNIYAEKQHSNNVCHLTQGVPLIMPHRVVSHCMAYAYVFLFSLYDTSEVWPRIFAFPVESLLALLQFLIITGSHAHRYFPFVYCRSWYV